MTEQAAQPNSLSALSGEMLLGLADPRALIGAVERVITEVGAGRSTVPERHHLSGPDSTLLVMPCEAGGLFGTKLVSLTPANAPRGQPVTQGLMVLFDGSTGAPLALLDAASLTCQRTGAVAALGIRELTDPGLDTLGIVGCGVQGAWVAIQAASIRPIRTLHCLARSEESFTRFSATIARFAPHLAIERCETAADLLRRTECVVTATTATRPVLPEDPALLAGKLLISIGSYRPHMQELPDTAFRLAGEIIVDSPHAATEVGDLINPLASGLLTQDKVIGIGEILAGRHRVALDATRLFKSVGYAAFDLFVAELLYRLARERGLGQEILL